MAERRLGEYPRTWSVPSLPDAAAARRWLDAARSQLPRRLGWADLWRLVWLPFWLGSELSPLTLPHRQPRLPAQRGPAGDRVVATLDAVRRRFWVHHAVTLVLRAIWLTVGLGIIWLFIELAGGPALKPRDLVSIGGGLLLLALVLAGFARPSRRQTARMLDRSFQLHERLSTALDNLGKEIPADGARATMVYRQIADAANAAVGTERQPALRMHLPVRELVTLMAAALLFLALFFLRGGGAGIPPLAQAVVPQFTPPAQMLAAEATATPVARTPPPTPKEVQEQAARSSAARQDLQTLGNALDNHAVTRPAAESIDSGDYQTAADQLRSLSNQADKLSPQERASLANDLNQAASKISSSNPDLANAARQAASGLQQGGQAAQKGVNDLGNAVEKTGNNVVSQPQLASEMQQAQAAQGQTGSQSANGSQSQQGAGQPQAGQSGSQGAADQSGSGQQGQAGQPGTGQNGGSQASGSEQNAAGAAQGEGQGQNGQEAGAGSGQQAGEGQAGQANGQSSAQGQSGAGAGAGAGAGQPNGSTSSSQQGSQQQTTASQGQPPKQNVVQGNGGGQGNQTNSQDDSGRVVQLPTSNGSGSESQSDLSSSSYGSGNGAVEAQGSVTQGSVGPNGPDSNRVPPQYRDIVKGYFDQS